MFEYFLYSLYMSRRKEKLTGSLLLFQLTAPAILFSTSVREISADIYKESHNCEYAPHPCPSQTKVNTTIYTHADELHVVYICSYT